MERDEYSILEPSSVSRRKHEIGRPRESYPRQQRFNLQVGEAAPHAHARAEAEGQKREGMRALDFISARQPPLREELTSPGEVDLVGHYLQRAHGHHSLYRKHIRRTLPSGESGHHGSIMTGDSRDAKG